MKKIKPYFGLIIPIFWIAFYNLILAHGYERIEFRFYFFYAILIGLTLNFKRDEDKGQSIFKSIITYIIISFIYDWYTFIDNEIIMSPHSFFNLLISGIYSFGKIINFSSVYISSFKPMIFIIQIISIGIIILLGNLNLGKFWSKIDLDNLLKRDKKLGSLIFLASIVIMAFVNMIISNLLYKSFFENLSETAQNSMPKPTGISFWMILTMLLFSLIQVYTLYILCVKDKIEKSNVFLIYFLSLFLYQVLFSIITGESSAFARFSYFDTSLFIVLEVILLSILILKYNSIVGFLISIILIWGVKVTYQFFIFNPDNVLEYFIGEIKNIYIPIITGLIAGTTYYLMNKMIKPNNYAS